MRSNGPQQTNKETDMFEAQYLMTKASAGLTIYSPWFPRQADNVRFNIDLDDVNGATLDIVLFHKNREDTGDGSTTGTSISALNTLGRTVAEFKGLKEMVRYKFVVKADSNGTLGWILFRMLPPIWFDSVSTT